MSNKFLYMLAPFLAVTLALLSVAVIPFGPEVDIFGWRTSIQLTDLNIGVLFLLAISSLGVYGIALAGWSSNSKYALLGGLRSSAQMISYELPLALAVVAPLLLANTLSLQAIGAVAGRFLLGFSPPLEHLPTASPADRQLRHFSYRRPSPKPTACRSICRRRRTSWSPGFTPNTAA